MRPPAAAPAHQPADGGPPATSRPSPIASDGPVAPEAGSEEVADSRIAIAGDVPAVGPNSVVVARPSPADTDGERRHLQPRAGSPAGHRPSERGETSRGPASGPRDDDLDVTRPACTVAQLRRFIKSRPWIPMHELRRRFGIVGTEDDVTPIRVGEERLYIGLPTAEGRLVADLLAGGDIGYQLSLDPDVPIVVGVFPMRPVPRT